MERRGRNVEAKIAQLGERMTEDHKVRCSIHLLGAFSVFTGVPQASDHFCGTIQAVGEWLFQIWFGNAPFLISYFVSHWLVDNCQVQSYSKHWK